MVQPTLHCQHPTSMAPSQETPRRGTNQVSIPSCQIVNRSSRNGRRTIDRIAISSLKSAFPTNQQNPSQVLAAASGRRWNNRYYETVTLSTPHAANTQHQDLKAVFKSPQRKTIIDSESKLANSLPRMGHRHNATENRSDHITRTYHLTQVLHHQEDPKQSQSKSTHQIARWKLWKMFLYHEPAHHEPRGRKNHHHRLVTISWPSSNLTFRLMCCMIWSHRSRKKRWNPSCQIYQSS